MRVLAVALLLVWVCVPCRAGPAGRPHTVALTTDRPAAITYTVQARGGTPQTFSEPGPQNELRIEVQRDRAGWLPALKIRATSPGNPFFHYEKQWEGHSKQVHYEGTSGLEEDALHLDLDLVLDWGPVAAALLAVLGVVAALVLRQRGALTGKLAQAQKTIAATRERLTEAELQTGLFPADGSNPRTIGQYEVVDRLGAGGMAVVYRVRNERGEEFALKLPLPNCLQDEEFKRRFRRELKIGVRLMHPSLVRIMDVNGGEEGEAYPYPFLVMELVRGRTLEEIDRPVPLHTALRIAGEMLDALAYVHAHGVIHRDVKPSNVMMTEGGRARLMDFGVAHRDDTVLAGGRRLTRTDEILGTPAYMPPEQIAGQQIDARADLYALGILVYEMLAGRLPLPDDPMQAIFMKMTEDLPPLVGFPAAVAEWLDRMIARDREARFATAEEARAALNTLMP
ncbi:MAG: serine/threonine protein kinase [Armatimonadetes bacterium]|nr:serine/threonine protein kinase [Armatimonadota bacterium]